MSYWTVFLSVEYTKPVNIHHHCHSTSHQGCLSGLSEDYCLYFNFNFIKLLALLIQSVIINSGTHSVCSVFILPCQHCLIPSRGRLSGVSGTFLLFSNQAHCRRVGSALLGNYKNPVTGFKWWSCVCRERTASVYITASLDWWFLFWGNGCVCCTLFDIYIYRQITLKCKLFGIWTVWKMLTDCGIYLTLVQSEFNFKLSLSSVDWVWPLNVAPSLQSVE